MPAAKDGGRGAAKPKPKVKPKSSVGSAVSKAAKGKDVSFGPKVKPAPLTRQHPPQQFSAAAGVGAKSKGTVKVKKKNHGIDDVLREGVKRALDLSPIGGAIRGGKAIGKIEKVADPIIPKPVKQGVKIVDKGLSGDYVLKPAAKFAKDHVSEGAAVVRQRTAGSSGLIQSVSKDKKKPRGLAAVMAQGASPNVTKTAVTGLERSTNDVIDLAANAVPSVYVPGRDVARGKPGEAAKKLAEPVIETAKHPVKSFKEHPVQTYLLGAGIVRGASMGVGKAARTAPSKATREFASTKREPKRAEGLPLRVERKHPKGIVGNRISKARDKRKPAPEPTTRDLQHAADVHVGVQQDMARIHRAKTAEATTKALRDPVTPTRVPRKGRVKQSEENIAATSVAAQGIASRAELPGLLAKARAAERRMRDELAVARDKDKAAQIQLRLDENLRNQAIIEKAIKSKSNGTDTAAARYAAVNVGLQEGLGRRQIVEPARGERARLIPYAVAKMDARHDPQLGLVGPDTHVPASRKTVRTGQRVIVKKAADPDSGPFKYDPTPEAINARTQYHGSGTPGLTAEAIDTAGTNHASLFGQGFYTTDARSISKGYMSARAKDKGGHLYEARLNVKRPLDLEAKPDPRFTEALATQLENLAGIGDAAAAASLREFAKTAKSNDAVYKSFRERVADFSHGEMIPTSELVYDFQVLADNLRQHWDSMVHVGGKRTGNNPHQVVIVLDRKAVKELGPAGAEKPPATAKLRVTTHAPVVTPASVRPGGPLSNEAIRAHMAENGVKEPAYVTHAPGQGGNKNYGLGTSRTGKPTPSISPVPRTGKAVSDVTMPLGKNTLMEANQKAQGLIDAHDAHADMLREVGFRAKDPKTGKPVLVQRDKYDGPGGIQELVRAQNAKGGVQWRAVRATVFADTQAHLKQIVDDARTSPEQIDLHVNEALRDALKPSESNPGNGPWVMVPDAFAKRVMDHLDLSNNTTFGKGMQAVTSQSRKVVLVTNPKWLAGNVIEPIIVRAPIGHVGPRSKMTQMTFMDELSKTQPRQAEMLHSAAMGGGNVSLTSRMAVKQTVDRYQGTALEPVAKGLHTVLETPGPKQVAALWNASTHFVFDRLNGTFEREMQGAFLGKALREHPLLTEQGMRLSNEAIRQAAHGKVDLGLIVRLSDEVKRGFGQYDMFNPSTRWMVQNLTPFIPWYLNALKFCLSVLPKDHPVATALLVAANQATEDWRKLHGQKMSVTGGGAPAYLQGSIPGKDGTYLRASRYMPFGAFSDPLATAANSVLSLASGVLNAAEGLDWKNSPLAPGRDATLAERGLAVGAAAGDVLVPGMSQTRRLIQGRTPRQVFDPFVYTSPPPAKGTGVRVKKSSGVKLGKGSGSGGVKLGGGSSSGGVKLGGG